MSTTGVAVSSKSMTKDARKKAILRFLSDTDLALPRKAIYVNMKRRGATFSSRTVMRHLTEMEEQGYVRRLDDPSTFFVITDAGREWIGDDDHE